MSMVQYAFHYLGRRFRRDHDFAAELLQDVNHLDVAVRQLLLLLLNFLLLLDDVTVDGRRRRRRNSCSTSPA